MVIRLRNNALPGPLPELRLGSPELFAIAANYQSSAFPLFPLLFFWAHLFTFPARLSMREFDGDERIRFRHRMHHLRLQPGGSRRYPEGKPLCEAAS
jgi:hypothetical protein